jgi:nucleobase:cation symporter-1, NCS1 family
MGQYENFLLFIGAMFIPLFGVVLTDYFIIRKGKLDVEELFKTGGAYWYYRGFHVRGILSWIAGFVTFELMTVMKYSVGASLPSMAVAGLCYYLMARSEK